MKVIQKMENITKLFNMEDMSRDYIYKDSKALVKIREE